MDIVPVFGSVYGTWCLFYEAIFHKLAPKEVILLVETAFSCVRSFKLTLWLVPWLPWFGRACGSARRPEKPEQEFNLRRVFKATFGSL